MLGRHHDGAQLVEHVVVRLGHVAPVDGLEPLHQAELVQRGQAVLCGIGGVGPAPRWEYSSPDPVLSGLATLLAGVVATPAPG